MAKVRKEEIRTTKFHLELDYLEAAVVLEALADSGYESAGEISVALYEQGVSPIGAEAAQVFAPLLDRPNHYSHDSLGDPATCTGRHNHPERTEEGEAGSPFSSAAEAEEVALEVSVGGAEAIQFFLDNASKGFKPNRLGDGRPRGSAATD